MKNTLLPACFIVMIVSLGAAHQGPPAKGAAVPPQSAKAPQVSDTTVIGLGDVLWVQVWKEPDHSMPQAVVRPDGKITLPLIGDVQAAGYTPKQLQDHIADRLKGFLELPTVTVGVSKIESLKVNIVGQVGKPGAYPMFAPMTVLDLIAMAGGVTEFAKTKDITIVRKKDGKLLRFNYNEVIRGKKLEQNVILENGDTVMVP